MKLYNQNSRQLLLFLFSFFSCIICFSQGLEPRFGSTNGDVTEIISDGTYTYIGGKFTAVFDSSEEYGHGVVMDASTGTLEEGFPYVNRIIETIIPDGNGGWYIGGSFSQVGGITRSKLAHILADNTVDAMFNPGVIEGIVYSIELFGSDFLTIAGTFTSVNEQPRKRLARIHKETGALEDWAPSIDGGEVRGTVVDGDNLLVYGSFTNVDGGTSRGRMTKINSTTGEFGDFDPKFDQRVNKAIIEGDNIIAGGAFTSMYEGTIQRSRLVKMNKNTGVVSASWNPAPTSTVNDILLEDGFLYVSGFFSTIGGANADKFAKLDVATGVVDNTFDFNFKTSNGQPAVYDITSDGSGSLYIAGKFTEADNVRKSVV